MDDKIKSDAPLQPTKQGNDAKASEDSSKVQETPKKEDPSSKLTPDHPRFKDVLRRAKEAETDRDASREEIKELKATIEARQDTDGTKELTPEEEAALTKIEQGLKSREFITKQDLDASTRQIELARDLDKLGNEFDGDNGLPKFDSEEVVSFAKSNGFPISYTGLKSAHFSMNQEAFIEVEAKRRTDGPQVPSAESPTSPADRELVKGVTSQDVAKMTPEEYEKNRDSLKESLRPKNSGTGM